MNEIAEVNPTIVTDEIGKLLLKIDAVFKSANYLNLNSVDREDWGEILGRAVYELETCGDDRDIVLARASIRQAQRAGNRNK